MSINARTKETLPKMPSRDAWTEAWRKHWSKAGQPGYELAVGGRGGDERDFLTTPPWFDKSWRAADFEW